MPEHLSRERISALLDDPQGVPAELDHLSRCPDCAREYEQMSRMRMALSGLPEIEPPAGEWMAVQERLGMQPLGRAPARDRRWPSIGWPLQAAAVISLFAAGLMVGQRLDTGADGRTQTPAVAAVDERDAPASDAGSALTVEPADAYLRTVADLQSLRGGFDDSRPRAASPEAFVERITHLDALIDASRDALREAPADPVLNNLLFQLVDERDGLAGELDQTLRMTAAEY